MSGVRPVALAAILAVAVSACGSDRGSKEPAGPAGMILQVAKAKVAGRKAKRGAAPAPVDAAALTAAALDSIKGSVLIAQIERLGGFTALGQIGENAGVRTYATPSEQALLIKSGVLVGSRGLGDDLMSSDADAAIAAIRSRSGGAVKRVYRYLDGEGVERPLPLDCTISAGKSQELPTPVPTVQLAEACVSGGLKVQNAYWVAADGSIPLSRQWIGPALGYVTIQVARP